MLKSRVRHFLWNIRVDNDDFIVTTELIVESSISYNRDMYILLRSNHGWHNPT